MVDHHNRLRVRGPGRDQGDRPLGPAEGAKGTVPLVPPARTTKKEPGPETRLHMSPLVAEYIDGKGQSVDYFFWTYFKQSKVTASRMMMPENTN